MTNRKRVLVGIGLIGLWFVVLLITQSYYAVIFHGWFPWVVMGALFVGYLLVERFLNPYFKIFAELKGLSPAVVNGLRQARIWPASTVICCLVAVVCSVSFVNVPAIILMALFSALVWGLNGYILDES